MSKLKELKAIEKHIAKWAKTEWTGTTKMVIMSLMTRRRKLIAKGV